MVVVKPLPRATLMTARRTIARLRELGRDGRVVKRKDLTHPLFLAVRVHFGTLAAARRAAGLAALPPRHSWSVERVINELRALDRRGVVLRAWDIYESGTPGLLFALYKYIGSMKAARRLARLPEPARRFYSEA